VRDVAPSPSSLRYAFPKGARLLHRRQFQQVMQRGKRASSSLLLITLVQRSEGAVRMGVTVSRRYGKANLRNRFKRLVREAFRHCRHELASGLEFNVLPGSRAAEATLEEVKSDLLRLLPKR